MLTIYHSNHLDVLKDLLVELFRQNPPANPLEDEQILVQSPGMAQWLRLELAKGLGIAAGINFPLPASFLWQMYTRVLPDVPRRSAFNKESMTWKLMDLLDTLKHDPDFLSLSQYLASDDDDIRKFQLSGKIADIFDQYLVYRPDWILDWEQENDTSLITSDQPWQPKLWRALVTRTAELDQSPWHRANMHHRFLQAMADENSSSQLPQRLFIFGISALPPHFVESIEAMSSQCDVHLMVANPCQHYWGDERDPKYLRKLAARKLLDQKKPNGNDYQQDNKGWFSKEGLSLDNLDSIGNPLLGSMGKLGRDYFHQLHGLNAFDIDVFVSDHKDTLLGCLQKDIFELHDRTVQGRKTEMQNDRSLQFHSCHSPLREVEVLYDHLLDMFEKNPNLTPKDIVIMLPDIDSYAPWIQAVFGSIDDQRRIPYAISDVSAKSEHPVISAFLKLLELDKSRCSAPELMELLEVPAIQYRFNLTTGDLDILRQWTHESGIRWGLTPAHQTRFDLPELRANSWLFGIRRMLLGYAMPENTGVYDDILPMDAVQGMNAILAGYLASFIDSAEQLLNELDNTRSIEQWIQFTHQLLDRFFLTRSEEDESALRLVRETLSHLYEQLQEAGYSQPLSRSVFISYLTERLTQERSSQRFLAGQVNFCTLMPMRSIPFKIVCLLGMNDGAYPRSIAPAGFDLIARHSRRGDRSRRVDDRYLFLEALLSAQDILYISYVGRRIQDNSERIPSVLVTELLNYCEQGFGLSSDQLVIEHPLQPFSHRNFLDHPESDQTGLPYYSYIKEWLPAASRNEEKPAQFIQARLPNEEGFNFHEVELAELLRFYNNPCRYFFNRRLKVYFSVQDQALEETETFAMGPLENYQLKAGLLESLINKEDPEHLARRLQSTGELPHSAFGQILLDEQIKDLTPMANRLSIQLESTAEDREVNVHIPSPEFCQNPVHLIGWLKGFSAPGMLRYRPASFKGKDLIRGWIEHLCQCMTDNPEVTRIHDPEKERLLPVIPKQEAEQYLTTLVHYFHMGQNLPLPWFPETAYSWLKAAPDDNPDKAEKAAEKAFAGDDFHLRGECSDDYIQRVYPELTPVFTEMTSLTREILAPAFASLQEVQP
ncbi:exodeoxyribonuclease V subunit gamma [Endozoicomonas atrinae]|uniref:exodeoxyribonuclease V subunit gamma n=1 Tax=Endozoicomonas atrinae TaxID=1333660 RepID=UPI0008261AC5|nr:exodeoxyribonuclease V subunit gamma [Endozoicomonas atrinae]